MNQAPSIELPNQDAQCVSHIALDIGGSLIKLVYFSPDAGSDDEANKLANDSSGSQAGAVHSPQALSEEDNNGRGGVSSLDATNAAYQQLATVIGMGHATSWCTCCRSPALCQV